MFVISEEPYDGYNGDDVDGDDEVEIPDAYEVE